MTRRAGGVRQGGGRNATIRESAGPCPLFCCFPETVQNFGVVWSVFGQDFRVSDLTTIGAGGGRFLSFIHQRGDGAAEQPPVHTPTNEII